LDMVRLLELMLNIWNFSKLLGESLTAANQAVGQVNLADSTSNDFWYITGVQLEAGTSASDFEFLPVNSLTLNKCCYK
jgi:hypothetical protein